MKKIISNLSLALMAGLLVSACNNKEELSTLTAPVLSADPAAVVIENYDDAPVLTLSWTDVAKAGIAPKYSVQLTKEGDNDFAAGTSLNCSTTSRVFSGAELGEIAQEIGAKIPYTLMARIRVTAEGCDPVISNVITINVSEPDVEISCLYPIGEALPWGWSIDKAEAMAKNGSVFTWEGNVYGNAEFKFLTQTDWWPGLVHNPESSDPYAMMYATSDQFDYKFKVEKDGVYRFTIEAQSIYTLKFTCEFIKDIEESIVIEHLYLLGSATKTGWSLGDMEEMENKGNGIFYWKGVLYGGGEVRFPLQKEDGCWWPCLVLGETDGTVFVGKKDADNKPYTPEEDGVYTITIDTNAMTIEIMLTGEEVPSISISELYVLGDACDAGWSLDNMTAFTKVSDGHFEWTGNLKASGEFRFPLQRDWWPCLVMGENEGTLVLGKGDDDKHQIPIAEDGTYKITVDCSNMLSITYTIAKQ